MVSTALRTSPSTPSFHIEHDTVHNALVAAGDFDACAIRELYVAVAVSGLDDLADALDVHDRRSGDLHEDVRVQHFRHERDRPPHEMRATSAPDAHVFALGLDTVDRLDANDFRALAARYGEPTQVRSLLSDSHRRERVPRSIPGSAALAVDLRNDPVDRDMDSTTIKRLEQVVHRVH